jgi:two-component system, OmpR family, phosphate regulon sensor histidine kinase PhoR
VSSLPGTTGSARTLGIVLLLLIVLPLIFYSAFEISSLSEGEELMRAIYQRQLDAILFSLNQHAWDVSSSWATQLDRTFGSPDTLPDPSLIRFLERSQTLDGVVEFDSSALNVRNTMRPGVDAGALANQEVAALADTGRPRLDALLRFRRLDYRKLEPFMLPDHDAGDGRIMIVFARSGEHREGQFAGLLFRERRFINQVMGPKILDVASGEFLVAVFRRGQDSAIIASGPVPPGTKFQRRDLWLFPGHEIGIRLLGATVDEEVRMRFRRNLMLIIALDLVLLGGAILIYRSVRAQTEFARLKSTFVSNVSHELRTPLALIRMYAETLEMGRLKDERKKQEYYETILRETDRLSHLVNTILNFSRMEAGKRPYQMKEADLNELVRSVVETYRLHFEQHGIEPVVQLPDAPVIVQADVDAVTEAIINLVDNAIKYGGSAKSCAIRTIVRADTAVIEVEDHGIGIAAEHHRKIFDVFYRVPAGLVHETKGSGLGLSLVRHIMTAHNGTVEVTSEPGKGSTFRLVFPLSSAAPRA